MKGNRVVLQSPVLGLMQDCRLNWSELVRTGLTHVSYTVLSWSQSSVLSHEGSSKNCTGLVLTSSF